MKTSVLMLLFLLALPAWAEEPMRPSQERARERVHEMTPEQREQWRDERRQRREQWQQMSPEERHQLRRDVRAAGQSLYPRGPRRRE